MRGIEGGHPVDFGAEALRSAIRGIHLARADDLPEIAAAAGAHLFASDTVLYVADHDQVELIPLPTSSGVGREPVRVDGTLAGRAFRDINRVDARNERDETSMWMPMLDGTERLGVVEFVFGPHIDVTDDVRTACGDLAALLAEVLVTRLPYGDVIHRARRRRPLTLSAELQWGQLPPLTFVTPDVAISAIVMPTTEIAGDSFDYSVNGDIASIAIVDAMGHGLEATLLSMVAIGALRNARRSGLPLPAIVESMNAAVGDTFGPEKFVTAVVAELNTETGVWTWATCGHPPALVIRRGRVVKVLDSVTGPPLGLHPAHPELGSERLEPGDRILLYTDGVEEARSSSGEFFGADRLADFVTRQSTAGLPAAETLRRLNLAILDHQDGKLQDDATTLMVEWRTDQAERVQP
jgi:Stage II sporulation protein E (SpoIIE)